MWIEIVDGQKAAGQRAMRCGSRLGRLCLCTGRTAGFLILVTALFATGCEDPTAGDRVIPAADLPKFPAQHEPGSTDKDAPQEFTELSSGLKYRILRQSDGRKPTVADTVYAHYRGWLDDETEFDSSYKGGQPIEFGLTGVVRGWTQGLQFVGEGGMIELEIPGKLGYGPQGKPPTIPPNATLHFTVELVKIKK